MRIFIAGATGTLGRPLVKALVAQGHEVVGMTRSTGRQGLVSSLGARPVVADALDGDRVHRALADARPEVVVHLLTALPAAVLRAADLRATNRLREEGTRHLIRAALDAGSRRVVAESFMAAGVESNPASGALLSLESQLADVRNRIDTVALRFGGLYGAAVPHTRAMAAQLRAGRMFLPGGPEGRLSFVHLDDAVAAMLAVLGHSTPAPIYNVVDDEPMSAAAFLRELADAIGARRPRTLPRWVVKLAAPMVAEFASADMALDHDRLTQDLGWHPAYPSVHDGLREAAPGLREAA